ncbi:MAG: hypothetical protein QXK12_06325 [Candidatus Nezhaarchaeales archaeon]
MASISYEEYVARRALMLSEVKSMLSEKAVSRAIGDWHAKRPPRPCGLTIHPGIGCPYACLYCYIQDLGFSFGECRPYGLTGDEMVLAILSNPWFIPGVMGTFLAFGSVCEPFHESCLDKTMEYLNKVSLMLSNPCQVSSKASLSDESIKRLKGIAKLKLNPLITIIALSRSQVLEAKAPTPQERLETISKLRRAGFKPFLFLRPLIPGVDEVEKVISEAKRAGAIGVVVGGFKVSRNILNRLERAGIYLKGVKSPKAGLMEVSVKEAKAEALKIVREKGLIALKSACCANAISASSQTGTRIPCASLCYVEGTFCSKGCPNECLKFLPDVSVDDVKLAIKRELNVDVGDVEVGQKSILARTKSRVQVSSRGKHRLTLRKLETLYRRRITLIA